MNKKLYLLTLTLSFLLPLTLFAKEKEKPNIIFIKTDDQRYNSLSLTGHPVTQTPHIDQLAKDGVFFKNAFITSPICGPSRANFFTAQWERKNNIGFNYHSKNFITHEQFDKSWLMCLKKEGYFTGYLGKHHSRIGEIKEHNSYMNESLDFCYLKAGHLGFRLFEKEKKSSAVFSNLKNNTQIEGLFEATTAFIDPSKENDYFFDNADQSVKHFLHKRDQTKPFCLSINFNLPHAASIGGMGSHDSDPAYYKTLFNDQQDQFPFPEGYPFEKSSLPDNVFKQSELMVYYSVSRKDVLLSKKIRMARAVHGIDQFVGNLRKQLEDLGIAENTILVFTSDHGLLLGEHGLGGKTFLYEEAIRVPYIIYSPYLKQSKKTKVVEEMVVGQDIPATILAMCGADIPQTYQGKSLLPLMNGKGQKEWRKEVFFENLFTDQGYPRMEAVRTKDWKYIRYFSKENDRMKYLPLVSIQGEKPIYEELFYLKDDPKESKNLIATSKNKDMAEMLRKKCQALVKELAE